jgi:hypothetical protein
MIGHIESMSDRHLLETVARRQAVLDDKVEHIIKELKHMSGTQNAIDAAVTALQAQVAQQTTVEASAVTLLQGLSAQLTAALAADNINPADAPNIVAAVQALQTSQQALAASITANTPAATA